MIDLSKVKGLADDVKGAIKQIADAAGNVLWKSGPSTAIVTITGYSGEYYVSVSIDGTKYYSATTIEVPIGTVVECSAYTDDAVYLGAAIYVNGEKVVSSINTYESTVTYLYTVACNVTINLIEEYRGSWSPYGYFTRIEITEET